MNKVKTFRKPHYCLIILLLAAGCSNLSAVFSEHAYQQDVALKVKSLRLMKQAAEPYANHKKEVNMLKQKLQIAYQYALGRPNNKITAHMWHLLINPQQNLLGGFLARWKEKGTLSNTFIKENRKIIADAFDTIIQLESGKIKPSEVK